MRNVYWFNRGFKGDELAANFSNCIERGPYWYFWELQTYQIKLQYADFGESTFNSTLFAQNTTDMLYICTDSAENLYYYYEWKQEQFPTMNDFFLGFLQNLLSNVVRLQSIQEKMQSIKDEREKTGADNIY